MFKKIVVLVVGFLMVFTGCAGDETDAPGLVADDGARGSLVDDTAGNGGGLKIVATTTQAGDLAQILIEGSTDIELAVLMRAGIDPHLYQPTQGDITNMNQADLIIYSGLHLEGQFETVFEALHEQNVSIHALSDAIVAEGFVLKTAEGYADPHFWFDPRDWVLSTWALAELLSELLPSQGDIFRNNAEDYVQQLDLLYAWASQAMGAAPAGQRYLVTSHDAFQYFGDAFGWQIAAIQGLSTADAAGIGDIQNIVDIVLENGIPVLFVESSIPPDTIEAVIEAIAARGVSVRRGIHELFSDAMGNVGSFDGTYIGMIAHNVYSILQSYKLAGLDFEIPAWPAGLLPLPPERITRAYE